MLRIILPAEEFVFDNKSSSGIMSNGLFVKKTHEIRGDFELEASTITADDISVFELDIKCNEAVSASLAINEFAYIMTSTLIGKLEVETNNIDERVIIATGQHHTGLMSNNEELRLAIKGSATVFVVCFAQPLIDKFIIGDAVQDLQLDSDADTWRSNRPVTPAMNDIINAVINCTQNNCLNRLFFEAKMLELLLHDLEQLKQRVNTTTYPFIKANDLEKLELAKVYIGENLQSPCSLIELAHKVGINDFKLKKGFKEVFGTTVFGYLFDLRMEKAKALLLLPNYKISEVAHVVGYKNAHHFTVAFKKKFGYLPSRINRVMGFIIITTSLIARYGAMSFCFDL